MSTPFISAADLGAYLRRDLTDDALAPIALDAACTAVLAEIGQDLAVGSTAIVVDMEGGALVMPNYPLGSVAVSTMSDEALTEGQEYFVNRGNGIIRLAQPTAWNVTSRPRLLAGPRFKVTFDYGYDTIPADVRIVALTFAARIYDQGLVKQESTGGYQAIYAASESIGFSSRELAVLHKYKSTGTSTYFDVPESGS